MTDTIPEFQFRRTPAPIVWSLVLAALLVFAPASALAQSDEDGPTVGVQGGRFGLGFASAWPAYGVSGTLQVSETITAQAVLGFLGNVTNISARGWYRFNRNVDYDLYGYGALGFLTYRYRFLSERFTETGIVLGVGGGIEAGIQELLDDPDLPPIFGNVEVGIAFGSFDVYSLNFLSFGAGIHYRFGGGSAN